MSDRDWRELERAWEADPGDQGLLAALIAARRRAGQPVGADLLDARRFPARSFDCYQQVRVDVEDEAGARFLVGVTPAGGAGLSVPSHRRWTVHGRPRTGEDARGLCRSLAAQRVPSLILDVDWLDGEGLRHAALLGPGLESLSLLGLRTIRDADLAAALETLTGLLRLTLVGYSQRRAEATLSALSPLERLISLELHASAALASGLGVLGSQPNLERLRIVDAPRLSAGELAFLRSSRMSSLTLSGCDGVEPARLLDHLPRGLRELRLWGRQVVDNPTLIRLAGELPNLRELHLPGGELIDAQGVAALGELPLESLGIDGDGFYEHALALLPSTLTSLTLWSQRLGEEGLRALARLRNLQELTLSSMELTGFDPAALSALPLRRLTFRAFEWEVDSELSDDMAARLPPTLEDLSVRGPWSDAALEHLSRHPRLSQLELLRCPQLEDLGALSRLPTLRRLEVSFCNGLRALPEQLPVSRLMLSFCRQLGDGSLSVLPGYPALRELHLVGTFSDAVFPTLRRLERLRVLYLHGEGFSDAGVQRLREDLPAVWIVR